mgnify:CR=1 FL=1
MASNYLIIFDNTLNAFDVLEDAKAGQLIKMLADYHREKDISIYLRDPILAPLASIFLANIDSHKDAVQRRIEGNRKGGQRNKSTQVNLSQLKSTQVNRHNNNNNINNNINNNNKVVVSTTTNNKAGVADEFRAEVLSSTIKAEQLCKVLGISPSEYTALATMVIDEWQATDADPSEYTWQHLLNHIRIKVNNSNGKPTKEDWRKQMIASAEADLINTLKN